jgi:hypothetical protein
LKPRIIALNLLLVLAIGAIVWQARVRWDDWQLKRRTNLNVVVKPVAPPPLTPVPKPETPPATKYLDVATKDLFSKDRNPIVVPDPPKVEKVVKVMPPLPVVYGVLGLPSGTKAIMAEKAGAASKPVHQGDTIGEFKIASLDPQNVTFDWDDKQISKKIEDLIDRSNSDQSAGGQGPAVQLRAPAVPIQQPQNNGPPGAKDLGVEVGAPGQSQRACQPGDNSPAGTVVDGYKKTIVPSPFGSMCRWDAVH